MVVYCVEHVWGHVSEVKVTSNLEYLMLLRVTIISQLQILDSSVLQTLLALLPPKKTSISGNWKYSRWILSLKFKSIFDLFFWWKNTGTSQLVGMSGPVVFNGWLGGRCMSLRPLRSIRLKLLWTTSPLWIYAMKYEQKSWNQRNRHFEVVVELASTIFVFSKLRFRWRVSRYFSVDSDQSLFSPPHINYLCIFFYVSPMFNVEVWRIRLRRVEAMLYCEQSKCKLICYRFDYNYFSYYNV